MTKAFCLVIGKMTTLAQCYPVTNDESQCRGVRPGRKMVCRKSRDARANATLRIVAFDNCGTPVLYGGPQSLPLEVSGKIALKVPMGFAAQYGHQSVLALARARSALSVRLVENLRTTDFAKKGDAPLPEVSGWLAASYVGGFLQILWRGFVTFLEVCAPFEKCVAEKLDAVTCHPVSDGPARNTKTQTNIRRTESLLEIHPLNGLFVRLFHHRILAVCTASGAWKRAALTGSY